MISYKSYNYPAYTYNNFSSHMPQYSSLHTRKYPKIKDSQTQSNQYLTKTNIIKSDKSSNPKYIKPILEIFGIKLYFDDILLLCLIFLLYSEGIKDSFLFIILILLLLN